MSEKNSFRAIYRLSVDSASLIEGELTMVIKASDFVEASKIAESKEPQLASIDFTLYSLVFLN